MGESEESVASTPRLLWGQAVYCISINIVIRPWALSNDY
jgi:hypothetical protein